jgi:hypothetical protein
MKIEGVGVRCDGCERIEDKNPLAKDKRPFADSHDRFFNFVVPPSQLDPITRKPAKGFFRGIASASNPKMLAALHCCPGCQPKIKRAMMLKEPRLLPYGPLRVLMIEVEHKYGMKGVRIN